MSFKQGPLTIRALTPDVALVNVYYKVGTFYPPDGVNHGINKVSDSQDLITLVMVKKQGKWLLTAGQNTPVDAAANNPTRQFGAGSSAPIGCGGKAPARARLALSRFAGFAGSRAEIPSRAI